jgi:hypothetical protein
MQNGQLFHAPIWVVPTDAIESGLLPTPRMSDYKGATNLQSASGCLNRGFAPNLPEALILMKNGLIPTPTANDAKNITLPPSQYGRDSLPGWLLRSGCQGCLNPQFIEEMMGFPIGWTELKP